MSKNIKIGKMVLTEDDLKFPVTYNGEVFTMRYPSPFEVAQIEAEIVRKLGGYPRSSFPSDHLITVEATAYVNELIIRDESPDWFTSAWTCYDKKCIEALYRGYLAFSGDFQERIKLGESEGTLKGSKS